MGSLLLCRKTVQRKLQMTSGLLVCAARSAFSCLIATAQEQVLLTLGNLTFLHSPQTSSANSVAMLKAAILQTKKVKGFG